MTGRERDGLLARSHVKRARFGQGKGQGAKRGEVGWGRAQLFCADEKRVSPDV